MTHDTIGKETRQSRAYPRKAIGWTSAALSTLSLLTGCHADGLACLPHAVIGVLYEMMSDEVMGFWILGAHLTIAWTCMRLVLGKSAGWAPAFSAAFVITSPLTYEVLRGAPDWQLPMFPWFAAIALHVHALVCDHARVASDPGYNPTENGTAENRS